jgi:4-hydroxybenzoate polyprenyltransferase
VTYSDLKAVVIPQAVAGFSNAYSGWILSPSAGEGGSPSALPLHRILYMVLWIWLNLFTLDLANQRLEDSIREDAINKPWRPIPSGRLSANEARLLVMLFIPLSVMGSVFLGGTQETLVMIALNWLYNDLGGANGHFHIRDLLNALGFMCFSASATRSMMGPGSKISVAGYGWIVLTGCCIFATICLQDLYDQEGDRSRGRFTAPLVLGDWRARTRAALGMLLATIMPSVYLRAGPAVLAVSGVLGISIIVRALTLRSIEADKATFRVWCCWIVIVYSLPGWSGALTMRD